MVRATVLFPVRRGANFNLKYYTKEHRDFVKQLFGPALVRAEYSEMRSSIGAIPNEFKAATLLYFNDMATLESLVTAAIPKLREDIAKFTDITPKIFTEDVL